ncbi:MAG: ubiquitin-related modifier 1 [archaeon GB-1867-097]|nr:ubiquitin-related modifier 1 [Candidatus Culexmicrobium thermophilum]MCS7384818.1 ubiquitin-related modifier 1 [Candidatus Culexmicrobium thermophilum]
MNVTVIFLGPLRNSIGKDKMIFKFEGKVSVKDLLLKLRGCLADDAKKMIFTDTSYNIRPEIIILVNDISLDCLGGLDFKLSDGDVVVFLPTVHGG